MAHEGSGAHLPEPLDLFAVLGVVPVDGVLLPVVHVDLLHAAQHQLGMDDSQGDGNTAPCSRFTALTPLGLCKAQARATEASKGIPRLR